MNSRERQGARWIDAICRGLELAIAVALALMVVMVFGNVVLRYGFNSGIPVSEELSRWLFVWMIFIGALLALRDNRHLGTDVLVCRLPPWGRRACRALSEALMLGCTLLLLEGSLAQARINLDVEAPVTGIPVVVVYAAGVAFSVPAALLLLVKLWRTVSGQDPQ
ncbi:MAG TPA: TRAP transporter small permease [Burkholderiaceae bacterium]